MLCPKPGLPFLPPPLAAPPHPLGVSAHLPLPGRLVPLPGWVSRIPCGVSITVASDSLPDAVSRGQGLDSWIGVDSELGTGFYHGQWGGGGGVDQEVPLGTCRLGGPGFPWDGDS